MESIGALLKDTRTERGISLAEAHEVTKITVQNLAALEEDRFDSFPNRIYARAFLRDYANYLNLDSAALLDRYEAEWGPKPLVEPQGARKRWLAPVVIVFVLASLAAVAVLAVLYAARPHGVSKAKAPVQMKPAPGPRPAREPVAAEPPAPAKPVVVPAAPKELKLQLTGTGTSWIRVVADGQPQGEFTLTSGQVRNFTAKRSFKVRVGEPGSVRIHLNGQALPPVGYPGQPVTKEFTLGTLKHLTVPAGAGDAPFVGTSSQPAAGTP